MRSLFLKIFLLCWLVNVLVIAAFALVVTQTNLLPKPTDFGRFPGGHVLVAGQAAAAIHHHGGAPAAGAYLDDLQHTTDILVFVLDDRDRDILGRTLPPDVTGMAQRIRGGEPSAHVGPRGGPWVGDYVHGPRGERYLVIGMQQRPPPDGLFGIPGPWGMPMLGMIMTAGVIAFVLAYYITSPVRSLRTATRQFAAGDLTARVKPSVSKRRDAIGDLGREFDLMAARIATLITAQQRLLQDVSHELRSPLARLNVALAIASRKAGPDAADALRRIEHEAEQLNELIGQLLTLSRFEAGRIDMEKHEFDLATVVDQVAADADFEARERRCAVRVTRREPCRISGVEALLRSAIENVIRNAIHYTAPDTEVGVAVYFRHQDGTPQAVVTIRDHGPGVPTEHLASIFRPFHRVEDARDRVTGGVGLGLAIAERAAKVHGGNIAARNAPDGGLIVELCLPATIDPARNQI